MNKLQYHFKKVLRLNNVCKYVVMTEENVDINLIIEQMKAYIKTKGTRDVGPLIQYTKTYIDNDEVKMELILMIQCSNYIHNVEPPYSMESIIRIPNALYCRYTGPESNLRFAYDKINIEAFEEDITLTGSCYTIYVDNNPEEGSIIADVFMERADT